MITAEIKINGVLISIVHCRNVTTADEAEHGPNRYLTEVHHIDNGETKPGEPNFRRCDTFYTWHNVEDGALGLINKALDTYIEANGPY